MKVSIFIITIGLIINVFSLEAQTNNYLNAKLAFEKKQYQKAIDLLNIQLENYPKHKNALLLKIAANLENRNYQACLSDLSKIKVSDTEDYYLLLARANAGLDKKEEAIANLSKYLDSPTKLPENFIKSYIEFSGLKNQKSWDELWKTEHYSTKENILNNAKYAIKSGNYAEAADRLDEYLSKYNQNAEAYFLRGNVYMHFNDAKSALESYNNACKLKPEMTDYTISLANCNNKIQKYKTSLELLNKLLLKDSLNLEAYLARAEAYFGNGQYTNAQSDISQFRLYYPENENAQFTEARIEVKTGDYLGAISNFGKLIKTNPGKAEYFTGRADAYMVTKTYKYAIKDYAMALDLNPKLTEVYKAKAKAHQMIGEMTEACNEWQNAARLGDIESQDDIYKYCK
ncbi:MAG: tetratricopeptide repeat protein [Bacteroidales bacterium]